MTTSISRSAVVVYSSPSVVDTQFVRNMLIAAGIHANATEVNEPFAGLPIATSEVIVWREDEDRARTLIEKAATLREVRKSMQLNL